MDDHMHHKLDAQLVDALTEAVALAPTREARAAVISDLVNEIDEVVKWRNTVEGDTQEVVSVETLVDAATDHADRMHEADLQ